jgi:4-hydroxybenzoate polyprenyltransferase
MTPYLLFGGGQTEKSGGAGRRPALVHAERITDGLISAIAISSMLCYPARVLLATPHRRPRWHAMLVLGRVSNLPTVWSNCLAGWFLGGGGDWRSLPLLLLGASFLYVGGMFLNDAFDREYDRVNRRERPIPSGEITAAEVWRWGLAWLACGMVSLMFLGWVPLMLGILLTVAILAYDALHKLVSFAPLLMAVCRLLLYWVAAACAVDGVTGLALWSSLALASYVSGLSVYAARERSKQALPYWPIALLSAPVFLAWVANTGPTYGPRVLLLASLLAVWIARAVQKGYRRSGANVPATVSGLLAGIVLVDLLAIAGGDSVGMSLVFLGLFGLTRVAQRFVPAT